MLVSTFSNILNLKQMKNFFLLFALLSVVSCIKNQDSNPPEVLSDYNPMKIGNYWVYQIFKQDNAGVFQPTNQFDSTYIVSDTIVSGNQYFKFFSTYGSSVDNIEKNEVTFLRDSGDFLISGFNSRKIFSATDFSNELSRLVVTVSNSQRDTIYTVAIKMENNTSTSTPLGTFNTITANQTQDLYPNYRGNGGRFRNYNTRFYGKNIGVVKEALCNYASQPIPAEEKRLVRYHLN